MTEFIIIVDKHTIESLSPKFLVKFLQNSIMPAGEEKNTGVTFDSEDTFDRNVGKVCHVCYYHLRDLRHICKFLTVDTAVLLANVKVSSRLDYCNSLPYGVRIGSVAISRHGFPIAGLIEWNSPLFTVRSQQTISIFSLCKICFIPT